MTFFTDIGIIDTMNDILTLSEASKLSGIDEETLKKKCQSLQIPGAIKKGKTWLIPAFAILGRKNPKVGVYIDGSNIYHGGKKAGWQVNYFHLKNFIEKKYNISIISYYNSTGYQQDEKKKYLKDKNGNYIFDENALKFENALKGAGFRVVTKPLKFILNDEKKPSNKTDGDLMIDAILEEKQWDKLILLAGDCDFEKLVKQVITIPKPVHIFSFETRMSHELKVLAFSSPYVTYTKLEDLETILKYEKSKK